MKNLFTLQLKHFFILCSLLLIFQVHAKRVEIVDAADAGHFFIIQTLKVNSTEIVLDLVYTAVNEANPADALYYVFNISGNQKQGFVIVSADDIARPILGYSLQGFYNQDYLPPNFEIWMSEVAELIRYGIEERMDSESQIYSEWKALLEHDVNYFSKREGEKAVNPLITTKWNQFDPYNQQCPIYQGTRCATGCVATAMAQVMKYHAYPASGTGTTPAYTTSTYGIPVPAVTLGETYQWSSMINEYNNSATQSQKDAVSLLMYHCGVSVKMNYGPQESGAVSAEAGKSLTSYFKYDKSMRMEDRSYMSDNDWISILKQELDASRPLYYKASGPMGGHAFVCDGYNNSNLFHFNWGWSGQSDGYYSINALNPGGYQFPNAHAAFVGLKPDAGGALSPCQIDMYYGKELVSGATSVQPQEQFTVSAQFFNSSCRDAIGLQGAIGLYQGNNLIATMGVSSLGNLQAGYYFSAPKSFNCQVPAGTPPGNYIIRSITKTSDSDWKVSRAQYGMKTELPLQVTPKNYTINAQAETGGTIDPSGSVQVPEGGSKTFTIKANAGYKIFKVLVNGYNNADAVASGSYTFTNVTANQMITAGFERITHTITATAGANGTITPSGIITINEGESQTFTIKANNNYEIDDVLIDGTSAGAISTYTFSNVTKNHTIEATFKLGTGIEETDNFGITIYPNPTTGEFRIEISDMGYEILEIDIFDVFGRIAPLNPPKGGKCSFPFGEGWDGAFSISHLPTGIYFVRITTENGVVVTKVVKQ